MVTGDHPATAEAIARDIGRGGDCPVVVTAESQDADGHATRAKLLLGTDVIARSAPGSWRLS